MAPDTRVNCVAPGFVPTNFAAYITKDEAVVSEYVLLVLVTLCWSDVLCHVKDWIWIGMLQKKTAEEQTLLQRLGTPEDMAAATAFLASDDACYITGETLVVAGGIPSRL